MIVSSRRRDRVARGFSLLELMVAIAVLVIGIFGTLAALMMQTRTRTMSNDNERAAILLEGVLADYHSLSPQGAVNSIHTTSDLTGQFTDEQSVVSLVVKVLSELQTSQLFPGDIDGDGDVDADDLYDLDRDGTAGEDIKMGDTDDLTEHLGYKVVPIQIELQWRDSSGQLRTRTVETLLYPRSSS